MKKSYTLYPKTTDVKSDVLIGKHLQNKQGEDVGVVLNASFNKKFRKLYLDVELDSSLQISIKSSVNITKENNLIFTYEV